MGIRIELHNPHKSYNAGEDVTGRLIVDNSRPPKLEEIRLTLTRTGSVHLLRSTTKLIVIEDPQIVTSSYQTTPKISGTVGHITVALRRSSLSETSFACPFTFRLPRNLPSSFKARNGDISYFLEVAMCQSSCSKNKGPTIRVPLIVNGVLDLSLEPRAYQTQTCSKTKRSNLFLRRFGDISFRLALPQRSGFVPGEVLEFQALLQNNSNKRVTGVVAYLLQVTFYSALGEVEQESTVINSVRGPSIEQGEAKLWKPDDLIIPAGVPPSRLGRSVVNKNSPPLIHVQYSLHLEMDISGMSSSLIGKLPILIGTIPLRACLPNWDIPTGGTIQSVSLRRPSQIELLLEQTENEPIVSEISEHAIRRDPPRYKVVAAGASSYLPTFRRAYNLPPPSPKYRVVAARASELPPPSYAKAVSCEGGKAADVDEYDNDDQRRLVEKKK